MTIFMPTRLALRASSANLNMTAVKSLMPSASAGNFSHMAASKFSRPMGTTISTSGSTQR